MARFDIYLNPGKNKTAIPYLLEVQSNVISSLATRIVIPLRPVTDFPSINLPIDLCPTLIVDGKHFFLDTAQLGALPARELKNKIGSVPEYQFSIQTALDRAFGAH